MLERERDVATGASATAAEGNRRRRGRVATRAGRDARAGVSVCVSIALGLAGTARAAYPSACAGALVDATSTERANATAAPGELTGEVGEWWTHAPTGTSTMKRCFSDWTFARASSGTGTWTPLAWPPGSATTNETSIPSATFVIIPGTGGADAVLRPDAEGMYAVALVDSSGCRKSRVVEVKATWTCEPVGTNDAMVAVFVAFAAACAFFFAKSLAPSNFEDERNVLCDVKAAYGMIGRAEEQAEEDEGYKRELRDTLVEIESNHLTDVTKLDLQKDLRDMLVERKRAAREREAKASGMWNETEEEFQRTLYERERALRKRTRFMEQVSYGISKSMADVNYQFRMNRAKTSIYVKYNLSRLFKKEYWCMTLLQFQLRVELLAFTAFAWRRTSHSNEMYRDGVADVLFYPNLFGPGMKATGAADRLTNWFFVLLFGAVICPVVVKIFSRVRDHFDKCMWTYAEFVEMGGDRTAAVYLTDDDVEGGAVEMDEPGSEKLSRMARVLIIFSALRRWILFLPPVIPDDFDPVRKPEKYRKKIVPDDAWKTAEAEDILRAVRVEISSPINMRVLPRRAADRMQLVAKLAIKSRLRSRRFGALSDFIEGIGYVLRVFVLRVALAPMLFAALGLLMVTSSFVPTPWVHASKDISSAPGDNLFFALFLGLGAIAVSMKMAVDSELLDLDLRPVPIFEIVNVCLKVLLCCITAYMEAELPDLGVPALNAEARITSLHTFQNFLPILICVILLFTHLKIQSLRGFGHIWNGKRLSGFAGSAMFFIVTFSARIVSEPPPWASRATIPHRGASNWGRPGVIIGIITALVAMGLARIANSKHEYKCLRKELKAIGEPKNIGKTEDILTPEFMTEQIESEHRRDRVTALVAFYSLLDPEQSARILKSLVDKTKLPRSQDTTDGEDTNDNDEAWTTAKDAFEELAIIVSCISNDPAQEFLRTAGEEFLKGAFLSYIEGTIQMTLWCKEESSFLAYEAVHKLVTLARDCMKSGETKSFQATIASVTMECIQSLDFAYLMSTLLFNDHDIKLDVYGDGYAVSARTLRRMIDDAFEIEPRPVAKKLDRPITHVRDPVTDEIRKLDRVERVMYIARSWLRPALKTPEPELNWLTSMGYYATVGKLQAETDGERIEIAHDFLMTLLRASLSTDEQVSYFAIRTISTLVRVGDAAASVFQVDGLSLLFECRDANVGTSKETFISDIIYGLTNDANSRSEYLTALASILVEPPVEDERYKLNAIELLHQALKLEMSAVYKVMRLRSDETKMKYKASMTPESALYAHDALYGMLIDTSPEVREHCVYALVDLITLFVWGSRGEFYVFTPPVTKEYQEVAFAKFLDEAKRKMPGGALMSTSMYRHLHRKKMTDSPQKDADKLLAVLLKVFNTDGDSQVRGAAENALKDVKALMSEEQAAESLALYDEKTDPRDARGSAPSRKILREVTAAIHASVERQHEQDATASKLRMNEFWRKMKERSNVNTTSQPRVSTKGGKVEVTARDKELTTRSTPGGRLPIVKDSIGFKRRDKCAAAVIVRHPPPASEHDALDRQKKERNAIRAKRLIAREATQERWYGGENFSRNQRAASISNDIVEPKKSAMSKIDELNKRPTITPPSYGLTRLPKEFRTRPRKLEE